MQNFLKKILFVEHGGNIKKYAIKTAQELGLDTYVVSTYHDQKVVDWLGEDHFFVSDTFDSHALLIDVLRFIEKHHVKFDVITTFRENCVIPTADLADAFGLRGVSPHGARRSSQNKALMRHYLASVKYSHQPAFALLNLNEPESEEIYSSFPKPCVAKPLFGTASHGVVYCDDLGFSDLKSYMANEVQPSAREIFSKFDGTILLEEYKEGALVSVDGIVSEKQFYPLGTLEFVMGEKPYFTQIASYMPARLSNTQYTAIVSAAKQAVQLLGFENCGVHAEFRVHNEEVTLVEIAARLPGATIHDTYAKVYNVDLVKALLKTLLDGTNPVFNKNTQVAYHHLIFPEISNSCTLKTVTISSSALSKTIDYLRLIKDGGYLQTYPHNPTAVCGYLLLGHSYEQLTNDAQQIDQEITIEIENKQI